MEFMQSQSDKSFDLAIVDPPYGINYAAKPARSKHEKKNWDNDIPNDIYFLILVYHLLSILTNFSEFLINV